MKKLKLYLETSVWNFLFADDAPEKKIATEAFFAEIERGGYSLFISDVVEREIVGAEPAKRKLLFDSIAYYQPYLLEVTEETRSLMRFYINNGLLSEKQSSDIAHLAVATVHEMEILTSWNMKHIVKRKTRAMVNALNQILGYRNMDICTPEEVVDYDIS